MAASLSCYTTSFPNIRNCSNGNIQDSKYFSKNQLIFKNIKKGGGRGGVSSISAAAENFGNDDQIRQNIPTKKINVDPSRQGLVIEHGYRQKFVVRFYEVGADKTARLESIFNFFQETALNHVLMSELPCNEFGAMHGMVRNNLTWAISRMLVQIDHYPIWGEALEIETWVRASGKNGMRRDWLIQSQATPHIWARATSTWVMINETTRCLSKMPEEVRAEISPWFIEKKAKEDVLEKIVKLDNKAEYLNSDLMPKRSDLYMNQHVNNVTYLRWMLETIPDQFVEFHQLSDITLDYRKECGISDKVQSLCDPEEDDGSLEKGPLGFTHLLQIKGENQNNKEIVRGKTTWRKRVPKNNV